MRPAPNRNGLSVSRCKSPFHVAGVRAFVDSDRVPVERTGTRGDLGFKCVEIVVAAQQSLSAVRATAVRATGNRDLESRSVVIQWVGDATLHVRIRFRCPFLGPKS